MGSSSHTKVKLVIVAFTFFVFSLNLCIAYMCMCECFKHEAKQWVLFVNGCYLDTDNVAAFFLLNV